MCVSVFVGFCGFGRVWKGVCVFECVILDRCVWVWICMYVWVWIGVCGGILLNLSVDLNRCVWGSKGFWYVYTKSLCKFSLSLLCRAGLRSTLLLFPLLGIAWLLTPVLAVFPHVKALEYTFNLLNSLQVSSNISANLALICNPTLWCQCHDDFNFQL